MHFSDWALAFVVSACFPGLAVPLFAQDRGHIFAHRGGAHEFEENTMQAFRGSYQNGIRGYETDVRMTKDGQLVLLHDDKLDRTHNGTGPVEHKNAAELKNVTAKKSGEPLPFLEELLAFLDDKPGFYLELEMKTSNKEHYPDERLEEYCKKLLAAAKPRQPKGSYYVFTSFDERPLKIMKRLDPTVDIMLITGGPCTPEIVEKAKSLGSKRIGVHMEGTSRKQIKEAQKQGFIITGWPGRSFEDFELAQGLGVDALCSDIPTAYLKWDAMRKEAQKNK